jgi:peptide/nickel transport system ATP-binding protein
MPDAAKNFPLLSVSGLAVAFYRDGAFHRVTHDISFELQAGELLGIVGESGSGKSVSSLAVMGLLPARFARIEAGEIRYQKEGNNIELTSLSASDYRKIRGKDIAMIFQEPMSSLNPVHKCGEQVAEMIRQHEDKWHEKELRERVLALFNEVKLPRPEALYDSYPHQLSGGQRQRIMIAMALSCNPRILIADEPTTALDVTVQAAILELLRELQQARGMGVILITHDLGVVAEVADRVLVMQHGRMVESGSVEDLFSRPKQAYTRGLIHCKPATRQRVARLLTVNDFITAASLPDQEPISTKQRQEAHQRLYAQEPLLSVQNLCTYFSSKPYFWQEAKVVKAVDDVSFDLFPTETLGLVGESGSGKSTIGRSIIRLTEPKSGEIWYKGKDVRALQGEALREYRKQVQIIFQDPYSSLNPRLTVGQAIAEPLEVYGLADSPAKRLMRVQQLLQQVGLDPDFYQRYPHEFSGGQRQRIVIARCLALEPETIICDESVSALDVSVQAQVLNLLKKLQYELNLSYIFISHDLSVIKHMSDRVLVLQHGKQMELGEADILYAQPQTDYTRKLIAALPDQRFEAFLSQQ